MFSTTFLGHQGWMFRSESTTLLVDPLLVEEFGAAHALDYRVFPPRILDAGKFPKIDALILTHEHDDHFDIPSLARLDRRIPVFLSARSSTASAGILAQMGFSVRPLLPGVAFTFRDLEVLPLAADHLHTNTGDEWDTLPFLVRHLKGSGSFFSTVDVAITQQHLEMVKARVPRPGLLGYTNNAQDWSHVATYLPARPDATLQVAQNMLAANAQVEQRWGPPRAVLMCAGGFSFFGPRAWLNERVFCVDTEFACAGLKEAFPGARFTSTLPGQTFHMKNNVITSVDEDQDFLRLEPRDRWPSRVPNPSANIQDYAPATGRTALKFGEIDEVQQALDEFAGVLVGTELFKGLHSLFTGEFGQRKGTFAIVLRDSAAERPHVFEYSANACAFVPVTTGAPVQEYIAGLECWAADFLAVMRAELGPIALSFGRAVMWNVLASRWNFNPLAELSRVSHPLRRPGAYLRIYQRLWKPVSDVTPDIHFNG